MNKQTLWVLTFVGIISTVLAGDLKISGDTHFTYVFDEAAKNEFQLNRSYFTFEKKVSEELSYKFQTDVGSGGATDFTVYLKNAMLAWKTGYGKVTLGLQGMNMFKVQEGNWGYRFIEKSAMDLYKYSSSADLGIGWYSSMGAFTPSILITNGTGYKKAESDGYKKLSANLLYGPAKLKRGLNAGVSFSYEPKDYDVVDAGSGTTSTEKGTYTVIAAYGAWAQGPLRLGAETAVLTKALESAVSTNLVSVYGNYGLKKNLSAFGRFDMYSTDTQTDNYAIIGLNYVVEKALHIAPNMQIDMPESGDTAMTYRINFRFKI